MVTDRDLYVRTIDDVIDYYGETQVALILNVARHDLDRWLAGKSRPPTDVFFRIIELKSEVEA
jgi:hypothetical protein